MKLVESDGIIGGGDIEVWLSLCCDEDLASCHAHTEPQKLSLRAGSKYYHVLPRIQDTKNSPIFHGAREQYLFYFSRTGRSDGFGNDLE